jgi:MraZ protein
VFRGVSVLNLDVKGRLAVPARYREELAASCASRLILTVDRDRCLLLYPETEWFEIERKLSSLPSFNPKARSLQRLYLGYATEVEMDGQGRILLPPKLKSFAGIDKRVAMAGQGNKFELWDEDTWDHKTNEWLHDDDLKELESEAGIGTLTI